MHGFELGRAWSDFGYMAWACGSWLLRATESDSRGHICDIKGFLFLLTIVFGEHFADV